MRQVQHKKKHHRHPLRPIGQLHRPPTCNSAAFDASDITQPFFVFLKGKTLMVQIGDKSPQPIGDFPDLGKIEDALLADKALFLLRQNGIQRVLLSDCSNATTFEFNEPVMSGNLLLSPNGSQVFYGIVADSTRVSDIGFFEVNGDLVHPIRTATESPNTYSLIGVTEDGKGLYLLQYGQDPALGLILVIDIENGNVGRELSIEGWGSGVLAPNRRAFATPNQVINTSEPFSGLEYKLNVYDLPSLPLTSPHIFTLPNPPSEIGFGGLHWSPDSQKLYFLLIEPNNDPQISYGLWSLAVTAGSAEQVTTIPDPSFYLNGISPDGTWSTIRDDNSDQSLLVNIQTGKVSQFSVPVEAILVGWQ